MKVFDYIFFRTFNFFKSRNDFSPETKGSLIVSLIQFFTILSLYVLGQLIFSYPMLTSKWQMLPMALVLGIFNWYRYEKRLDLDGLQEKWKDENNNQRTMRGILIVIYLTISVAIPVLRGMAANDQL